MNNVKKIASQLFVVSLVFLQATVDAQVLRRGGDTQSILDEVRRESGKQSESLEETHGDDANLADHSKKSVPSQSLEKQNTTEPEKSHASKKHESGSLHGGHGYTPKFSSGVSRVPLDLSVFGADPDYKDVEYDHDDERAVYGGKSVVKTPRPLIELGYKQYEEGPLGKTYNWFGEKNLARPQFLLYGDARIVATSVDSDVGGFSGLLYDLNLEADLKITATERLHLAFEPLEKDGVVSREVFDPLADEESEFEVEFDPATAFFEGDIGAIQSGITNTYTSYDLPVAFGLMPLLVHNGIWIDDAFWGAAVSDVANNSRRFDITNYDVTLFFGLDEVTSNVFESDEHAASIFGAMFFADYFRGYVEFGYAYVDDDDTSDGDQSYHNAMLSFTKRYGGKISNSVRVVGNFGQDPGQNDADEEVEKNADGVALLVENSLVTRLPSTLIPYFNAFYIVDNVNPLARTGGLLKNTGLVFEADAETGFPSLDDVGVDAHGGAIGVEYLFNLNRQVVVEIGTINGNSDSSPTLEQHAVGVRLQQPIGQQWILRFDGIYADTAGVDDDLIAGEIELKLKF